MLDVSELAIQLGSVKPVRSVSFTLERGETLGLVGESGSGKTLTALALMGLLPPGAQVSGRLRLGGTDLPAPADEKAWRALRGRRIAMVFQEPMTALNPLHRVGRQVAEPIRLHQRLGAAAARVQALELMQGLGLLDTERIAEAFPHELSGGQRQRIALAMALAGEPELLIADEPTTALDTQLQGQALKLLTGLAAQRGMGLLLISHDLALVARHARNLLVMYAGQGVEGGPAAALIGSAAAHPYTQGLLAARPRLGTGRGVKLEALPGTAPDPRQLPPGCAFHPRCARAVDACAQQAPPLVGRADAHWARCLRVEAASHG